jgi:hypothetical protein
MIANLWKALNPLLQLCLAQGNDLSLYISFALAFDFLGGHGIPQRLVWRLKES